MPSDWTRLRKHRANLNPNGWLRLFSGPCKINGRMTFLTLPAVGKTTRGRMKFWLESELGCNKAIAERSFSDDPPVGYQYLHLFSQQGIRPNHRPVQEVFALRASAFFHYGSRTVLRSRKKQSQEKQLGGKTFIR